MSYIETFLNSNPADMSLRASVIEGHSQDGTTPTPLMYLANEFALAGSMGLQALASTVTERGILDQNEFTIQLSENGKPELCAIMWGSLIQELDNCLKDEIFDIANVVTKINSLTGHAGLPGLDAPRPSLEIVKKGKMNEIRFTHQKDPTDTLFFMEPYRLPNGIRKLLTEAGFFSSQEALSVVEAWKERAEIVRGIPTEEFDRLHRFEIEELLQSFDDFIS